MEQEALLAGLVKFLKAPSNTFSILNNADLEFPTVQMLKAKTIQLFSWRLWSINEVSIHLFVKQHLKVCTKYTKTI